MTVQERIAELRREWQHTLEDEDEEGCKHGLYMKPPLARVLLASWEVAAAADVALDEEVFNSGDWKRLQLKVQVYRSALKGVEDA